MRKGNQRQGASPHRASAGAKTGQVLALDTEQRSFPDEGPDRLLLEGYPTPEMLREWAEPPLGKRWKEFPPEDRQEWLAQHHQHWKPEEASPARPGPFAGEKLTGAEVYWLAAYVVGETNVAAGLNMLATVGAVHLPMLDLRQANLSKAHLERASLSQAHLEGALLDETYFQGAFLTETHLESALLTGAHLEGANLWRAHLAGVDVRGARLDAVTQLSQAHLDASLLVADVVWNGVSLANLDWSQVSRLGDEMVAHQAIEVIQEAGEKKRQRKERATRIADYQAAIRANRQLAVALRSQGINEVADRFAFRAQVLRRELLWLESGLPVLGWRCFVQRFPHRLRTGSGLVCHSLHRSGLRQVLWTLHSVWRRWHQQRRRLWPLMAEEQGPMRPGRRRVRQRKLGAWLWSLLLSVLAGYGYKPGRSLLAYLVVICGFMGLYLLNSRFVHPHLTWDQALVLSVSCFHGRGFFEQDITLGSTYARLAACEAVIGLLIEVSFIATFTQRFLSR